LHSLGGCIDGFSYKWYCNQETIREKLSKQFQEGLDKGPTNQRYHPEVSTREDINSQENIHQQAMKD